MVEFGDNKKTVSEIVSKMADRDVYAVMCSYLYDLSNDPKYATLSELCYLLDIDSLMKLLKYFSGQVIKIPTKEEVSDAIKILTLMQYYDIEKRPWKEAVELSGFGTSHGKKAHNDLDRLHETLKKCKFGNRTY